MIRIAVEDTLTNVEDMLKNNGYDVVRLGSYAQNVDCIVISGQDKDMMGIENSTTGIPVVNAQGLTAEEVYSIVHERVKQ
ncbi:YkuS family protein [Microaerobacter geothermalis]|uniref:YkuS family protein n=1 Tax=Microaerobacter geothermalis TaxID=674972 RepID=UPI001F3C6CA2|nr:YkuS family protein [Microaerobacter geothermalis]MCF6094203.1 YkuS family protein [Microaerobacter geothermalis]